MSDSVASDEIFGEDSFDSWSDSSEWSADELVSQPRKRSARILSDSSDDGAQVEVGGNELVRFHSESVTTETSANLRDDSNENLYVKQLEKSLGTLIESHRKKLKDFRRTQKASNAELLNSLGLILCDENVYIDNENAVVVMYNSQNLMELEAGPEASKFGRLLGRKMFGEKEDCLLKTQMLGPGRSCTEQRERVAKEAEDAFDS